MNTEQTLRELAVNTDTQLAKLIYEVQKIENRIGSEERMITKYSKRPNNAYNTDYIEKAKEIIVKLDKELDKLNEEIKPLDDIYLEHRWARYYYVPAGHVHNYQCHTIKATTTFYWLPAHAGMPVAELIDKAGDRACTVCFPDAPVNKPTTLEEYTQDQDAKEKRRKELEEKRAEAYKEAIKDENGEVVFKSMRAANTIAGRAISSIVYFYSYIPVFLNDQKNEISPEEHFARWDRSTEIANLNREIVETVRLMELNGGDDALEKAMKRFEKEVNADLKLGRSVPEGFTLDVFRNAGLVPSFKYPKK